MAEFDDIPEALRRDLKANSPRLPVSPENDDAVRAIARAELSRQSSAWRWAGGLGAVAAAVAVMLAVGVATKWTPAPAEDNKSVVTHDMTGDGSVDIRDAMVLARMLKTGQSVRAPWNTSIVLNEQSVQEIVEEVVRVQPVSNAAVPARERPKLAVWQTGLLENRGEQGDRQ